VAIEQRADNPATQHSRKCFLISLRLEGRDNFVTLREAANVQTLFIRGATAKACAIRSVCFLDTFFSHMHSACEAGGHINSPQRKLWELWSRRTEVPVGATKNSFAEPENSPRYST
jgi:hypothetical protein